MSSKKYLIVRNTYNMLENGSPVRIPEIMFEIGYGDSFEEAKEGLSKYVDRMMAAELDRVSREVGWMKDMAEQVLHALDFQDSTVEVVEELDRGKSVILADNPRAATSYPKGTGEFLSNCREAFGLKLEPTFSSETYCFSGMKVRKKSIRNECCRILEDNWECPIKPAPREQFESQFSIIPIDKTRDVAG